MTTERVLLKDDILDLRHDIFFLVQEYSYSYNRVQYKLGSTDSICGLMLITTHTHAHKKNQLDPFHPLFFFEKKMVTLSNL